MRIINTDKYRKDLLATYDDPSIELEVLDRQPLVSAIPITDKMTNGDVIKAMFPNCEQKEHMNNGYFEMYFDNDLKNASYMRVSKDWWNAPYKEVIE